MDRRNFVKSSCTIGVLTIATPVALLESCTKDNTSTTPQGPTVNFTLDLSKPVNAALNNTGGSVHADGVIVVNTGGSFIAIAETCTHAGCMINYNKSANDFVCPCHGGTYDLSGNVISGPPPAPLKKYTVVENGNNLTVSG